MEMTGLSLDASALALCTCCLYSYPRAVIASYTNRVAENNGNLFFQSSAGETAKIKMWAGLCSF